MKRRQFLTHSALFAGGLAWAASPSMIWRTEASSAKSSRLIVIFLRGAVDGLSILVPFEDEDYYAARPSIAIAPPGEKRGALPLDDRFGLHPSLAPLMPLWQQKKLAFIPASGSPDPTRSHFEAQDYMESGTPGQKKTQDGWLNRLLAQLKDHYPIQALNIGNITPRILMGRESIASMAQGRMADRPLPIDQPQFSAVFDYLYQGQSTIARVYQEGRQARELLLNRLQTEMEEANQGSPLPNNFVGDAQRLAKLMNQDSKIRLAFLALGGWDTHVAQNTRLPNLLTPLGQGLALLMKNLGKNVNNTMIVVMSEFGRMVKENGSGGTDHGHGNVMWLLGGNLNGGQIYGDWQGLNSTALYEKRDVPVLTDFREPLLSILAGHLQLTAPQTAQVFPGYSSQHHFLSLLKG